MNLLNLDKGLGKTAKAIELANKTGAYLIVKDKKIAQRLSKKCNRYPITHAEFLEYRMIGSFVRIVVIDDIDLLLHDMFAGSKVEMVTASFKLIETGELKWQQI